MLAFLILLTPNHVSLHEIPHSFEIVRLKCSRQLDSTIRSVSLLRASSLRGRAIEADCEGIRRKLAIPNNKLKICEQGRSKKEAVANAV